MRTALPFCDFSSIKFISYPECYHHDIVSLCDSDTDEYTVRIVKDEVEGTFVRVRIALSFEEIIVEDGRWYIV